MTKSTNMTLIRRLALLATTAFAALAVNAGAASANVEYVDASTQEPCGQVSVFGESVSGGCDIVLNGTVDFYTEGPLGGKSYVTGCSVILEASVGFEGTAYIGNIWEGTGTDFHSCGVSNTDPVNLAWDAGSVAFTQGAPRPFPFQGNYPDEYLLSTPLEYALWGYQVSGGDVAINLLADGSGSWQGGTDGLDHSGTVTSTGAEAYVDIDVSGTQTFEAVEGGQ